MCSAEIWYTICNSCNMVMSDLPEIHVYAWARKHAVVICLKYIYALALGPCRPLCSYICVFEVNHKCPLGWLTCKCGKLQNAVYVYLYGTMLILMVRRNVIRAMTRCLMRLKLLAMNKVKQFLLWDTYGLLSISYWKPISFSLFLSVLLCSVKNLALK